MENNSIICLQTWVPLRKLASSSSEMVSSLIFGETASILTEETDWFLVKMHYDGYEGWVGKEYVKTIANSFNFEIITGKNAYLSNKLGKIALPAGAQISKEAIALLGSNWEYIATPEIEKTNIAASAIYHFLHTPYLWGGRCNFGIDCSGLIQIVLKMANIPCARDAWQQYEQFKTEIEFGKHTVNDIAFFVKNEKITHVGILINENTIIHASGMVRIDTFTNEGIINTNTGVCTHKLSRIKRVF